MDTFESFRQTAGLLTPLEQVDKNYKEKSITFFQAQIELINEQKEYSITIKKATKTTAIATVFIALGTIVQLIFFILNYFSNP